MHTSSNVDVADMYAENITKKNSELFYEYDGQLKPVKQQAMSFRYKTGNGFDTKTLPRMLLVTGP